MKYSAGTLLYKLVNNELNILIVHPSGKGNKNSAWSIPKGTIENSETQEAAARRETFEETGMIAESLFYLGDCVYKNKKKTVHCFAGPSPTMEPKIASWEIDQAIFVPSKEAKKLLHSDQVIFLEKLEQTLNTQVK